METPFIQQLITSEQFKEKKSYSELHSKLRIILLFNLIYLSEISLRRVIEIAEGNPFIVKFKDDRKKMRRKDSAARNYGMKFLA